MKKNNGKKSRQPRKNVILLGITSLFNDISSEMIAPILPLLIQQLGGTGIAIGLIGGIRNGFSSTIEIFFGFWSDKIGKPKRFVFAGYIISTIFKLLLYFAKIWYHIFLFVGLERIGKAVRTAPRDAILSKADPKQIGQSFGIHRSFDTFGAALGSLLTFILLWIYGLDFKTLIIIATAISFISMIPLFSVENKTQPQYKMSFTFSQFTPAFKWYLGIESLFALANISYMFFILKAQQIYVTEIGGTIPILLYVLFNISYAASAIPIGILSDNIGRWKTTLGGYLLFAFTCIGIAFAETILLLSLFFILYGVAFCTIKVMQKAYVSDLSSEHMRATALGTFYTVTGGIMLAGSIIAGFLWEKTSPTIVFVYAASITLFTIVLFILFRKKITPPKA